MDSTYNEEKSVVAERSIRTLKNKIFKPMITISKNVYFDVLDDIVNKYNNTLHRTIKMKPIDVTSDSYAEYNEDSNDSNEKDMIIRLIVGLIKKMLNEISLYKNESILS